MTLAVDHGEGGGASALSYIAFWDSMDIAHHTTSGFYEINFLGGLNIIVFPLGRAKPIYGNDIEKTFLSGIINVNVTCFLLLWLVF